MTTREPPNYRKSETCLKCKYLIEGRYYCTKHDINPKLYFVCDDYESEEKGES